MATFKRILFPVDFSEEDTIIAPHIIWMARHYGAHVSILHVIEIPAGRNRGWPEYGLDLDLPAIREERNQCLSSFLAHEFEGLPTSRAMLDGDPGWEISQYVENEKIDLIMMPTHGYGLFRRFLLGSVTAKLLHDVKCPMWTAAHTQQAPSPPSEYRNVLCAMDLSSKSLPLLQWAYDFAREHGANLKLMHAIPAERIPGALESEGGTFRNFLIDWARADLAKLQKEAGTSLETVVEAGDVAHVVASTAKAERADLVVIGRGVMQHVLGRMRTNVYSIIRESPCPVISI